MIKHYRNNGKLNSFGIRLNEVENDYLTGYSVMLSGADIALMSSTHRLQGFKKPKFNRFADFSEMFPEFEIDDDDN